MSKQVRVGNRRDVYSWNTEYILKANKWTVDKTQRVEFDRIGPDSVIMFDIHRDASYSQKKVAKNAGFADGGQGQGYFDIRADASIPIVDIPITVSVIESMEREV